MPRNPTQHKGYVDAGPGRESDVVGCNHCQKQMTTQGRGTGHSTPIDMCHMCMRFICPECASKAVCDPWEEKLLRIERRDRFIRASGAVR